MEGGTSVDGGYMEGLVMDWMAAPNKLCLPSNPSTCEHNLVWKNGLCQCDEGS